MTEWIAKAIPRYAHGFDRPRSSCDGHNIGAERIDKNNFEGLKAG